MDDGSQAQHYPVSFTGTGWQYFKIWIVNILLTILTLYIYSAWAKVRTKRYFHGNTVLDGSSFEYHAKPLQILLSRLVAAALFIAFTFGSSLNPVVPLVATGALSLIIPWAIWRSTKFNMRMTSYRNVRFGFDGPLWPVYLYQLVLPLIVYAVLVVAFFILSRMDLNVVLIVVSVIFILVLNLWLTAYTHHRLSSYFLNHYLYGKSRFKGELSTGLFYKTYVQAVLLGVGALLALIVLYVFYFKPDDMRLVEWLKSALAVDDERSSAFVLKLLFVFYVYVFIVGYFMAALVRARVRNHVFAQTTLDKRVSFSSTVPVTLLWWVMASNVVLLIVTLGLARPYTQVRMARFLSRHSGAVCATPLNEFVGDKREEVGAFGDELGDVFDVDMDVGF